MKKSVFFRHVQDAIKKERLERTAFLKELKEAGFDGFEVTFGEYDDAKKLHEELSSVGLNVSCLCASFRLDSENDPEKWKKAVDDAKTLESKKILIVPGFARSGMSLDTARENMAEPLRQIADYAKELGVTVVIEDFDSSDSPISDSSGMIKLADSVPHLCFAFDTGNFRYSGEDEFAAFDKLKGKIAHVHLKDRAYSPINEGDSPKTAMDGKNLYPAPFGSGFIPGKELIEKLMSIGYDDYFVIEHYGAYDQKDYMLKSVKWLKENFG